MFFFALALLIFPSLLVHADAAPAPTSLVADGSDVAAGEDIEDRDIQALREWINTKRQVTVKELGGSLSISGEVHAEFQSSNELSGGIQQRGAGSNTAVSRRGYDIEAIVLLDYRTERSWTSIKLKFDNDAGIGTGTNNKIACDRAYWGYRVLDQDIFTFDVEAGRMGSLNQVYDSQIEFSSRYDGAVFKYDQAFDTIGSFYVHLGPFVINERHNHYGYVGEIGLLQVANTGFYTKYSLVDWDTKHYPDTITNGDSKTVFIHNNERYDYLVSQLLIGYKFVPKMIQKVTRLYIAGLCNHKAKAREITDYTKQSLGGYVGFSMGELRKAGDWNIDGNYQVVEAQSIPDFDVAGVGLGNAAKTGFYTTKADGTGSATTIENAGGNVNYRGYTLRLQYLLSNNLNLFQSWQQSQTLDSKIGPYRRFKQYEIDFIYAF